MLNPAKFILIDANNMCHRLWWGGMSSSSPTASGGQFTDIVPPFFEGVFKLKEKYQDHLPIIVWDGGKARRKAEASEAVEKGIVPSGYKENREENLDLEPLYEQMDQIREECFKGFCVLQVRVAGFEADDAIYTYSKIAEKNAGSAIIVSSDKDFYQCIGDHVSVLHPGSASREEVLMTKDRFEEEFSMSPDMWINVMALCGKRSDNIFGVDGWGPKTSIAHVVEHGGIDQIVSAIGEKVDSLTGSKKPLKRDASILEQKDRLKLAMSLQKMDFIEDIPEPVVDGDISPSHIKKSLMRWGCLSLSKKAHLLG